MVAGYNGTTSLVNRLPFFFLLGLFGAVGGRALSVTGYFLKVRFTPPRPSRLST
ncbi:MAG: hypothetical protein NVSMB53_18610 [Gemmatimonadaceae bacterium]